MNRSYLYTFRVANCDAIGENSRTVCTCDSVTLVIMIHKIFCFSFQADGYLSQLKVQLTPQKLPQDPKARQERLSDLSNAISEIAEPVVNEGQTLLSHLGPITLGSKGIKKNVDKIEVSGHFVRTLVL